MNIIDNLRRTLALMVLGVGVLAGLPANAIVGTLAGTEIDNAVTLDYSVASVSQDQETTETTFLVDRKLDVVVASVATDYAATITVENNAVAPGTTDAQLLFTVTNQSNYTPDMLVAAFENLLGPEPFASAPGGSNLTTDNSGVASAFGSTNTVIGFNVDSTATTCNDTTSSGEDDYYIPQASFDEGLGTPEDNIVLVCIYVDLPTVTELDPVTVDDTDYIAWTLVAGFSDPENATTGTWLASDDAGIADVEFDGTDPNDAIENVFGDLTEHAAEDVFYDFSVADAVGAGTGQGASASGAQADGQHSDTSAFVIRRAVLDITKTSLTVWDPINGLADAGITQTANDVGGTNYDTHAGACTGSSCPKAIPGAVVQYHIAVVNNGSVEAESISIADTLQAANLSPGVVDSGIAFSGTDATTAVDDASGQVYVVRCAGEATEAAEEIVAFASGDVAVTLGSCDATDTADIYYYVSID